MATKKKAKPRKGAKLLCGVCGTSLIIDECGVSYLELICCGVPVKSASKKKATSKKKKAAPAKKKTAPKKKK